MKSRFIHLKERAKILRQRGETIVFIETTLGIPRSTLSGWFKDLELSKQTRDKLKQRKNLALTQARNEAAKWHREQKRSRLSIAKAEADASLSRLDIRDKNLLELALAILYLAEGSKKKVETSLGSSDPQILRFFVNAVVKLYGVDRSTFRCQLFLRADQDPVALRRYWSEALLIPLHCFKYISIDQRTAGRATYNTYKGVCSVGGISVAVQRKLVYLSYGYFEKVANLSG